MINQKIFIGWVQWAWKSTIIQNLKNISSRYDHFSFWEELKILAENTFSHYTATQHLTNTEREQIVKQLDQNISQKILENPEKIFLFDNHFTIFRNWEIQNTFTDDRILFYNKLILLLSEPEIISKRIINNKQKERVDISHQIDFIIKHQQEEEKRADFLSKQYNIVLLKIMNNNLDISSKQIHQFIQNG